MTARPRYLILLEAGPDPAGREGHYRLKLALKTAKRRDGLRAIAGEEVGPGQDNLVALVDALVARCAAQSEALARMAAGRNPNNPVRRRPLRGGL